MQSGITLASTDQMAMGACLDAQGQAHRAFRQAELAPVQGCGSLVSHPLTQAWQEAGQ